ncbi:MAG: hypothetical protein ACK40X_00625 [Armatimonadota bacterium]
MSKEQRFDNIRLSLIRRQEVMTIICVSTVTLMSQRGTPCHLMKAMAEQVPVLFINPPHSLARWRRERKRLLAQTGNTNLQIVTPIVPTTFRFLPRRLRRWIVALLATPQLLEGIRKCAKPPFVLWSYLSELTLPLVRGLKVSLLCYHQLDDFSSLLPEDEPLEKLIEREADLLFVVSPILQERYAKQGRQAILLPNGVDVQHFSQALSPNVSIPEELAKLPSPRIGFVGAVAPAWVDTELLLQIARCRPNWSIIVIGPLWDWRPPQNPPPNCHFLGARPYQIIPFYLKGLDVCLILFKDNAITRAASPLKLYEYLAAGRAVVTSPIPDQANFSSVTWLAQTAEEFLHAIEEALKVANDPKEQQRRLSAVSQHSWQQRAQTALFHVQQILQAQEGRNKSIG